MNSIFANSSSDRNQLDLGLSRSLVHARKLSISALNCSLVMWSLQKHEKPRWEIPTGALSLARGSRLGGLLLDLGLGDLDEGEDVEVLDLAGRVALLGPLLPLLVAGGREGVGHGRRVVVLAEIPVVDVRGGERLGLVVDGDDGLAIDALRLEVGQLLDQHAGGGDRLTGETELLTIVGLGHLQSPEKEGLWKPRVT